MIQKAVLNISVTQVISFVGSLAMLFVILVVCFIMKINHHLAITYIKDRRQS
jgi:uncharacterized membrane protein